MILFFVKLITFWLGEPAACWFLFVKLNLSWYFSSWNFLCGDLFFRETCFISIFFSSWKMMHLVFLWETWCTLIFVHETCCMWTISSKNLIYLHLCLWETCHVFISPPWDLLHVDFSPSKTCTLIFLPV